MGSPPGKAQGAEVAQVHRSVGKRLVEFDHQRFIFHTNWPDRDLNAALPYPYQYLSPSIMHGGIEVTIRPIRLEDEPLMAKLHEPPSALTHYRRDSNSLTLAQPHRP